jgi:hypothetical protein
MILYKKLHAPRYPIIEKDNYTGDGCLTMDKGDKAVLIAVTIITYFIFIVFTFPYFKFVSGLIQGGMFSTSTFILGIIIYELMKR